MPVELQLKVLVV